MTHVFCDFCTQVRRRRIIVEHVLKLKSLGSLRRRPPSKPRQNRSRAGHGTDTAGVRVHYGRGADDRRHGHGRDDTQRPAQRDPPGRQRARPAHVRRDRHQRRLDQRHTVHARADMRRVRLLVLPVLQVPAVETIG